MLSEEYLKELLRTKNGSNELRIAKRSNVSTISLEQLKEILSENNIALKGNRKAMEKSLIESLGTNEVYLVDKIKIDTLNVVQLEKFLGISRSSQRKTNLNEEGNPGMLLGNNRAKKTIREVQQEIAENCGFQSDIIWDLLTENDADIMKNKIEQLIPDQEKGKGCIKTSREKLFENVWAQRKYTNRTSLTYIFYVMVTEDEDFNTAVHSTKFSCHPVFRCKKCENNSDTSNCCMIYVDEIGRVYQNWKSFVEENVLPPGTMVAPRKGIYNFDENNKVMLDIYCTPNGTTGKQIISAAQKGSAVMGIGAACVSLAGLFVPITAPVVVTAGLIGLGVGALTTVTSALNLSDRANHEQSINIMDRESRASYLGVIGGAVGVASAGATTIMTSMAAAGKSTLNFEVLVNSMNISSLVMSGSGVASGVLDLILKYADDDEITSLDILQLSASLVLFTHSVYNFQLASQIANGARSNTIKSFREILSNRQRKIFDKIAKETELIRRNIQGKIDIIRGVNDIPDRQYLNELFKINRQHTIQNAFGKLPSTHNSDTTTTQTPKMARLLYSTGTAEQTIDINQDPLNPEISDNLICILRNLAVKLPNGVLIFLQQYGRKFLENIADGFKFHDIILSIAENFLEDTLRYIMELAQKFIENFLDEIHEALRLYIPTESVLYRIVKEILSKYRGFSYEYMLQKGQTIMYAIKKYFLSLNPNSPYGLSKRCPVCSGMFYICPL